LAARAGAALPPEPPLTTLGGAILPGAAHLRLQSDTLGELALHLRVRDGVAHLRVEGEQAPQLLQHGQELQRALAAEGLKLGQLEAERPQAQAAAPADAARTAPDQGQGGGPPPGQRDPADHDATPADPRASGPGPSRPSSRRTAHHVEA
jgi:hypothetical protein